MTLFAPDLFRNFAFGFAAGGLIVGLATFGACFVFTAAVFFAALAFVTVALAIWDKPPFLVFFSQVS